MQEDGNPTLHFEPRIVHTVFPAHMPPCTAHVKDKCDESLWWCDDKFEVTEDLYCNKY